MVPDLIKNIELLIKNAVTIFYIVSAIISLILALFIIAGCAPSVEQVEIPKEIFWKC